MDLLKGLKKRAASSSDASTRMPTEKSTVNDGATRDKTASTPKTLGPRVA